MSSHYMTQAEADAYWADKEYKKFVVTLERGPQRKPEREILYIGARSTERAIKCAKAHATRIQRPSRIACRLATAQDLGCTRAQGN
jgi:hypothetical protein